MSTDGVHGADASGLRIQVIQQRDDGFLEWNRDVRSNNPFVAAQLGDGAGETTRVHLSKLVVAFDT